MSYRMSVRDRARLEAVEGAEGAWSEVGYPGQDDAIFRLERYGLVEFSYGESPRGWTRFARLTRVGRARLAHARLVTSGSS
jgi:hypothetical protein